uniref:Uncharacterized protein LOC111107023 n=1 Tax=Crassostrea virginica TaxID=6565 RepID=A0A8B8B2N1_CRAVI|nr:uncharacterized protein LOC111107023 [Crassostrea virginica]XP_022297667.1 uncharacterized protein LOC111107023 [Crassostrea virginica]
MKHSSPFDVHYCYRLDITGDLNSAMSVTCYDEIAQTTRHSTTDGFSTFTATNTNDVTTVSDNLTSTSSYEGNLSLSPYVKEDTCNKSTLFTVIVLLVLLLTAVACYAAILTFKYFTRVRSEWNSPKLPPTCDIYEEIPAGHCISSPPIYETNTQPQQCRTCQNGSPNTLQSNVQSHWNWTYDDQRASNAHSHNPPNPSTYEYEVAKF